MPLPVFNYVVYLSPWQPLPPGWNYIGVDAVVNAGGPAGQMLAGRLRQGSTTIATVVGTTLTEVVIVPDAPLSTMLDYFIDVQWVPAGTQPIWAAGTYSTAPVVTAVPILSGGTIAAKPPSQMQLGWDFGAAAITPAGANITAFNSGGTSAGFSRVQGTTGAISLTAKATPGTMLYLQAVMPIAGGKSGFTQPFTMGPIITGAPLPIAAPAIIQASFDGSKVQVAWTAPAPPSTGGAVGYELVVAGAGSAATAFPAAATGALAAIGPLPSGSPALTIAGRVSIGPVIGPAGDPLTLLTLAPAIDQIAVAPDGQSVGARATFPAGVPSGAVAQLELLQNGAVMGTAQASQSGATVTLTGFVASSPEGWTVVGRMGATVSGAQLTGPASVPLPVPTAAPVIRSVAMTPAGADAWAVTVEAAAPPPTGASLLVTLTQAGKTVSALSVANGNVASFTLSQGSAAAGVIDGNVVATATAAIVTATATSPAAQATFIGAAPTIASVQNIAAGDPTGAAQGLYVTVTAASAQQSVTVRLSAGGETAATATGAQGVDNVFLPLTQPLDGALDWMVEARWTGGGVTDQTWGGWSAPAPVLTSSTTLTSADFDNGQLSLAVAPPLGVSPAPGVYLYAAKTTGGSAIKGTNVIGTRGTFALSPGSDVWQAGARPFQPLPASADSRSLAPSSALVPLLLAAPVPARIDYDGATLSASWGLVDDVAGNPATGAVLRVDNADGTLLTASVGSTSGTVAVQIPPAQQGVAKVAVRAVRTTAVAALSGAYATPVAPIVAAPTLGTVTLSAAGDQVNATLALPADMPTGTTYQAWLMASGQVVAGPVTATVSGNTGTIAFSYAALDVAGLSIVAQALATVSGVQLSGPRSPSVPVLATPPRFASVAVAPDPAHADQWRLDASWAAPADGAPVAVYALVLTDPDGGTVAQATYGGATSGTLTFAKDGIVATGAYTLTLAATSGNGSATPVATVPVWFASPGFVSVAADQAQLAASWTAPTGPVGSLYLLSLIDSVTSATLTTVETSATSATIDIAGLRLEAGGSYELGLATRIGPVLLDAGSDGTAKTRPPLLLGVATTGRLTLTGGGTGVAGELALPTGMPAGTGYRAWLMAGAQAVAGPVDATISGSTGSVAFTYAALGVAGLTVVTQAQASTDGVALTGPLSAPVPVLATPPGLAAVGIATDPLDAGQWRLAASWRAPADSTSITSYWLTLTDPNGDTVADGGFGGNLSGSLTFAKQGIDATGAYTLTLTATSANGSTAPAAAAAVWFASPSFTAVTAGQTQLSATWSAPEGPVGLVYRLSLIDGTGGGTIAAVETSATTAMMDIAALHLNPDGRYLLTLSTQLGPVVFAGDPDSTYKTKPVLLLATPRQLIVATSPATGKATVSWSAVAGATGYTVMFSDGSAPAAVTAPEFVFANPLEAGTDLEIAITASIASDGVTSTGPASAPLVVPTAPPALISADYDGTQASASWQPVAGAAAYVATVLAGDGSVAATAPATSATATTFAVALAATPGPYSLVVQSVTEAGTGLPSAALPLFQTGWFVSTAPTSTAPPHVFPAATLALAPEKVSIYLPPLGTGTVGNTSKGPFALTAVDNAAFPYVLTFAADSDVWTFSTGDDPVPPIRPLLQSDYVAFLQQAQAAGASPWGIAALQQAIARWMPQTFEELHYYSYGLDITGGKGTGSIDLRQGLVLRVGFADYTNVWSADANSWLNGFGGGSPVDFDVGDSLSGSGAWQLSMDAFATRLVAAGAMSISPPATLVSASASAGVADAADLLFPNFPNPFYRLFFPGSLQDPTSTGSVSTASNFALASAANYTALGASSPIPSPSNPVVFFRGRAVLRLMIRIRVNGVEIVVPLGTTVGNILDRYGVRPPASAVQLTGLVLDRAAGPGIPVFGDSPQPPPAVYASDARFRVRLDWATMATYGGPVDATNLPLLHGDRLTF